MKQQKRGAGISIKNRIFLILTLSIAAMSMMLLFAARSVTRSTVEKYLYEYLYATQAEMGNSMEVLFDEVGSVSARLENSARLRSLLESNEAASKNQKEFAALMDRLDIDETAVGHVVAISRNGSTYASEENGLVVEPPDNWYLETLSASDYSGVPFVDWNHVKKDTRGNAYLLYGKTVKDTYDGLGETLGYVILYIPESALEKRYSRLDESVGYSYLLSSNDVVISHEDTAAIGSRQIDSRKYDTDIPFASFNDRINGVDSIVTVSRLDRHEYSGESILKGSGWRIVSVVSREMLVEPLNRINKTIALLALAALTASVLVTGRIARGITRPIRSMGRRLKSFGRQDAPEEVLLFEENRRDEMWELESAYNDMLLRITELMEKNRRQSEQTRKQELTALQAQINPHFLYNTLDVVAWLAKIKKQPEIEQLILALGSFFRISLHKGEQFIRVSEEIELLRSYVTIEKIRFPGKISIEYRVEADIMDCSMMKIVLQPLVENAIKHGLSQLEGEGHILVEGRRGEGEDLLFEVRDDGVGFEVPESFLEKGSAAVQPEGGYGLRNVHERIRLSCGEGYGLSIRSVPGEGTAVRVRIREHRPEPVETGSLPG